MDSYACEGVVLVTGLLKDLAKQLRAGVVRKMNEPYPCAENLDLREYEIEVGDAVAFNHNTLHGARRNEAGTRRRAFSLHSLGDDMKAGQRQREDWCPMLYLEST